MPIWAKATASPNRTVIRRFSEASAMVAPPVHDLDGAFQTMVVSEASTSPATFLAHDPVPAEAAHEEAAAVGAVDQPVPEGELFRLRATHYEGEAHLRIAEQAAAGGRDAVQPVEGQPGQGGLRGGRRRHGGQAPPPRSRWRSAGTLRRDAGHRGGRADQPRLRRPVAVEDGVAAALAAGVYWMWTLQVLAQATSYSQSWAPAVCRATTGEQASVRSARAMIAEPSVSSRNGMATFGSSWHSSMSGASKTCRLWLE